MRLRPAFPALPTWLGFLSISSFLPLLAYFYRRGFLPWRLFLIEHVSMLGRPREPYPAALVVQLFIRGFHILAHGHQLLTVIEADVVARRLPHIDDLLHDPRLDGHARLRRVVLGQHVQLFRPDDEAEAVVREQVRDEDEPGHELG